IIAQPRFVEFAVLVRDGEPTGVFDLGRHLVFLAHPRLAQLRVRRHDGELRGAARDPFDDVSAVRVDRALLFNAVATLDEDRAGFDGLALVGDLAAEVATPRTAADQ